jgi:capping protein beta
VSREFSPTEFTVIRSPWSNTYSPEMPDGTTPSAKLRELEVSMNDAFDTYREQ